MKIAFNWSAKMNVLRLVKLQCTTIVNRFIAQKSRNHQANQIAGNKLNMRENS